MTIYRYDASVKIHKALFDPKTNMLKCSVQLLSIFSDGSGRVGDTIGPLSPTELSADDGIDEILAACHTSLPNNLRKDNYMQHLPSTTELKSKPLSELTALYNRVAPKDQRVKRFRDKTTALERLRKAFKQDSANLPTSVKKEKLKMSTSKPAQSSSGTKINLVGKRSKHAGKKIHLVADKNPRREGTAGHLNWKLYKEGMTYEDFILAKGGAQHLNWDIEHGFIELR